jgi:hypothetical protein
VRANGALIVAAELTVHDPTPEHGEPQPPNVDPEAAEADSVMDVPIFTVALHVLPLQVRPVPDMVPEPVPVLVTVTVYVLGVTGGSEVVTESGEDWTDSLAGEALSRAETR